MFTTSRRVAIATGAALALFATPLTALAEPAGDAHPDGASERRGSCRHSHCRGLGKRGDS